jgi:hypothetical protein
VRGGAAHLEAASWPDVDFVAETRHGGLSALFRLVVWDVDEASGQQSIRDIKEQQVYLVDSSHRDEPERVRAFVEAWASIMPDVLARLGSDVDCLMPHDLINFSPLALSRAETVDDFRRALLVKSRYGRFFADAPPRA